jgi:glutamate synthase (NADPH/NADH) large chain
MNKLHPGLYRPDFEHDACGIGFVANLKGRKSHDIIDNALTMLSAMEHRGGTGVDVNSGDGAGVLIQIPHELFEEETAKEGITLPANGEYGVGMVFFPADESKRQECREVLERNMTCLGMRLLGYRKVPVDNSMIGQTAKDQEPCIEQVFIQNYNCKTQQQFERKLYVLRNYTRHIVDETVANIGEDFYIASMSSRTLVYKGQLTTAQVRQYYLDLQDDRCVSALAMFHSRFATNTFPHWRRAQPFRYLSHNGEINTVKGNIIWLEARQALFESIRFTKEEMDMLLPIFDRSMSDSANLDMMVELLVLAGRPLAQAMMMVVPEAWQTQENMDPAKRAFYEYYACIMEPWDGPASISFTDGNIIGATLDRNGLRPSRYLVTDDGMVVMGSETGALVVDQSTVVEKGRLQPGKIFICDLNEGRIISDDEVKSDICSRQNYVEWVEQEKIILDDLPTPEVKVEHPLVDNLKKRQRAFGYTAEDLNLILTDMVGSKKEPLGSMGTDTPFAVLSDRPQHLSHYFKQLFAQVTNPPIDPIREEMVMSLRTYIGGDLNLLEETAKHCHKLEIKQPILNNEQLMKLRYIDHAHFQTRTIPTTFRATGKPGELERALERICRYAADAVNDGFQIIILSDRDIDTDHVAIPSVLATSAVHHHLIKAGLRAECDIVGEFGDVRETHHFATVLGFGASAVNPFIAIESLLELRNEDVIDSNLTDAEVFNSYAKAVNSGLLKIFSKMGISTLQSYQGAQIFEALGINQSVVDKYFCGTVSRIEGIGLDEIAQESIAKHREGYPVDDRIFMEPALESGGEYAWRNDGERHLFNPTTIRLLQHSTAQNDVEQFKEYCRNVDDQSKEMYTLRGLLKFNADRPSVPLDEVESVESIFKRFATGAMSFGSISWEAHTTLAIAMNRIGGKSNSGEGGEDPIRFKPLENGDNMISKIKQVASGRFGVTSHYLTNAEELQIKMAQGAKPGEGGQLPGHKVDGWIGRTRGSTPGVGLISPPPHHDIYSIEDLAQLIYDLKNANRDARINVKLVSEAGVGTIASGVCKAYADVVLISGHDGGTGASPISSIKHAGLPWELGLAETHQTLVQNGLRSRIVVQADGQMKTPRDLAVATLLGAEEWGVATAALVVEGCIMMRKCHMNTCPAGIATQDKRLRDRYKGKVENVVNFFTMMAQGLREIMAELGFRTINEMVGQVQCLAPRSDVDHWKFKTIDLSPVLYKARPMFEEDTLYQSIQQKHLIHDIIDRKMIADAASALENGTPVNLEYDIHNVDRSVGAMLSNEVSKRYHADGLPENTIKVKFKGSAGQSLGAFMARGVSFELEGDANDYCGKGLSGGKMVVYPDAKAPFEPSKNIIIGNVAFFGGTDGRAFIRGRAGERFCVRNSGVTAVVEGVGDHGCEYMTGGCVVILGETGRNFAAGMSGGVAFVYDKNKDFASKCNMEMVEIEELEPEDQARLKSLIEEHAKTTGSDIAEAMLADWDAALASFVKVMPVDYKHIQQLMQMARESGKYKTEEEISSAAFEMHIAALKQPKTAKTTV